MKAALTERGIERGLSPFWMKAGFVAAVLAVLAGSAGAQGGAESTGRLWEREPGVVVGPEVYGASSAVLQLLESGRLDDAAAECERAEGEQGLTTETGGNWLALADALWNAGEREAAGLAVERVWADEWPEDVRAMAQLSSEWRDADWSEMSRMGGAGADLEEMALATTVLQDCYRHVFTRALEQGAGFPDSLDDVPEWEAHVEGTSGKERELCERIVWKPEGEELASINLGDGSQKAVLWRGGVVAVTVYCPERVDVGAEPQEKAPLGQRIAERLQEKEGPVEGAIAVKAGEKEEK